MSDVVRNGTPKSQPDRVAGIPGFTSRDMIISIRAALHLHVHVFSSDPCLQLADLLAGTRDDWLIVLGLGCTATLSFDPHIPQSTYKADS